MESRRPDDDWPEWIERPGEPGDDEARTDDRRSPGERDRGFLDADPEPGERESADQRESAYELLQRGHALLQRRHHAQAATVLERAAVLEPGKGSILEALGRAYYNSGQHERSAETFAALIEVDPIAHYAHYALGQSLKQLGEVRRARTHLRLACALSPTSRLYRGALDRLPVLPDEHRPGEPAPGPGDAAESEDESPEERAPDGG